MKEGCSHASINTVIRNELLEAQIYIYIYISEIAMFL